MSEVDLPAELLNTKPLDTLKLWMKEASAKGKPHPDAFSLATVSSEGEVSSRILLCKEVREDSIVFYTNYNSHKGKDIESHPQVAANFHWDEITKQVKIQGHIQKLTRDESVRYWDTRPRDSQLSQWISRQSEKAESRSQLEQLVREAEAKFKDSKVPCPDHWGGLELIVSQIELWIGCPGRLHDRFCYTKVGSNWKLERLYP